MLMEKMQDFISVYLSVISWTNDISANSNKSINYQTWAHSLWNVISHKLMWCYIVL